MTMTKYLKFIDSERVRDSLPLVAVPSRPGGVLASALDIRESHTL